MEVRIRNFMGIEQADIKLHEKLTLLCANNYQGKTSILRAMTSVFLGVKTPIKEVTENRAGALVRSGASVGHAELHVDNDDTRVVSWPSCKVQTTGDDLPFVSEFGAGYSSLIDLDAEKRAKAVTSLTGSDPSAQDLRDYLAKKGIDTKRSEAEIANIFGVVDERGAIIRRPGGWDQAHKSAVQVGQQLKGKFESVTGTRWGSAKGGMWIPQGWEQDLFATSVDSLEEELAHAKTMVESAIAAEAIGSKKREDLEALAADKEALLTRLQNTHQSLKDKEAELKAWQEKKPTTFGPSQAEVILHCAHCNGENVLVAGKLTKPSAKKVSVQEQLKAQKALQEWVGSEKALSGQRDNLIAEIRSTNDKATKASDAEKELAALDANVESGLEIKLDEARETQRRAEVRLKAFTKKTEADTVHESIMQNQRIIDILAPDGLRQQVLGKALAIFNERLGELCEYAKWQKVVLCDDLTVTMADRPYGLLSASEQYRCRIILQVALAELENSEVILIDAAEILDSTPSGKSGLISLLLQVGIPTVVAMTSPKNFVPDLESKGYAIAYWIENGSATHLVKEPA